MKCACPCKREFTPKRKTQIYFDANCRKGDSYRRWPVKRQGHPVSSRNGLGKRQEAETSYVTLHQGTEMAQTKRERLKAKNGRRAGTEFLTSFEVADRLGLSPWALIVWRRQHKGPECVRLGRNCVRYERASLEKWLASLPRV